MADNSRLGLKPGQTVIETEGFQAQESAQSQANVIPLGASEASLRLFEATKLLQAAMVGFDLPSILGKAQAGEFVHLQVIGCPVVNVAVCGDHLEDKDETIALEMHLRATLAQHHVSEWALPFPIWIDQSIAF